MNSAPAFTAEKQTKPALELSSLLEPEPEINGYSSADMVYVPGLGWIKSQGSKQYTPRICTKMVIKSVSYADAKKRHINTQ